MKSVWNSSQDSVSTEISATCPTLSDSGPYLVLLSRRKIYHTNLNCKKLPKDLSKCYFTSTTEGMRRCSFCDESFYAQMARIKKEKRQSKDICRPVELNGDFPKKVMIPIYVTSDGNEFGCEIDALRHENTLLKRRLPR